MSTPEGQISPDHKHEPEDKNEYGQNFESLDGGVFIEPDTEEDRPSDNIM